MATLYELTNEYRQLLDMMEDGEVDPYTLADTLEAIDGELEIKAENYAKIIRELDGTECMLKAEIDRLSDKKASIEKNIAAMKNALEMAMRGTGKTKFKTGLFSFNIQKNGGKRSLTLLSTPPEEFCKPVPDNDKIRKALESGEALSFAQLEERGESLRIR